MWWQVVLQVRHTFLTQSHDTLRTWDPAENTPSLLSTAAGPVCVCVRERGEICNLNSVCVAYGEIQCKCMYKCLMVSLYRRWRWWRPPWVGPCTPLWMALLRPCCPPTVPYPSCLASSHRHTRTHTRPVLPHTHPPQPRPPTGTTTIMWVSFHIKCVYYCVWEKEKWNKPHCMWYIRHLKDNVCKFQGKKIPFKNLKNLKKVWKGLGVITLVKFCGQRKSIVHYQ